MFKSSPLWGRVVIPMIVLVLMFQNCGKSLEANSGFLPASEGSSSENFATSLPQAEEFKARAVDFIPQVRSVTWYVNYGDGINTATRNPEASAAEFVQQLPRIKHAKFNTVWISDHTTWSFMQPNPEKYRDGFNERELTLLKYMLDNARAQGLKVMLPINGYGYGHWHSSNPHIQYYLQKKPEEQGSNFDLCTWFNDQSHVNVWIWYKHYVAALLNELRPYHDMVYFFVYSEAGFDDTGTRCTMAKDFYQNTKSKIVRRTYGDLPKQILQIDPSLSSAVIGYHDDHAIADAWVSSDNLPLDVTSFDFVSTHGYYDGYDQAPYAGNHVYIDSLGFFEIVDRLTKRINRLKTVAPSKKIMLGEFGISNCRIPELDHKVSVFKSIRYAIESNGVGSNMWAWTPIYSQEINTCEGTTGGFYLTDRLSEGLRPLTNLGNWLGTNFW